MKSVRAHRQRDLDELPSASRLHVVSRNAPARPRWGHLYLALVVATAVGTVLHFAGHAPSLSEAVDLILWIAPLAALAGGIHFNPPALGRRGPPAAGPGLHPARNVRHPL